MAYKKQILSGLCIAIIAALIVGAIPGKELVLLQAVLVCLGIAGVLWGAGHAILAFIVNADDGPDKK